MSLIKRSPILLRKDSDFTPESAVFLSLQNKIAIAASDVQEF
jgi:hypothetical protein